MNYNRLWLVQPWVAIVERDFFFEFLGFHTLSRRCIISSFMTLLRLIQIFIRLSLSVFLCGGLRTFTFCVVSFIDILFWYGWSGIYYFLFILGRNGALVVILLDRLIAWLAGVVLLRRPVARLWITGARLATLPGSIWFLRRWPFSIVHFRGVNLQLPLSFKTSWVPESCRLLFSLRILLIFLCNIFIHFGRVGLSRVQPIGLNMSVRRYDEVFGSSGYPGRGAGHVSLLVLFCLRLLRRAEACVLVGGELLGPLRRPVLHFFALDLQSICDSILLFHLWFLFL